jgi:flagellar hook-associated protein 2
LTTGATFTHGKNALFTLNGGPVLSSMSNTLDSSTHGIAGLSVTVNTKATQTVNVQSDIGTMQTSIQDFLTKFNSAQDAIAAATKITVSGGKVSTSVLSDNHEVDGWASKMQSLAFESVSGLTGSVKRLDDLGIDFDSTTGHLTLKNTDKLTTALSTKPDDVKAFFLTPSTGFVSKMYSFVTDANSTNLSEQSNLTKSSTDIDTQIATIQSRLDNERQQLTASFITMLDAQSAAQSQSSYLTNQFFKGSSG